MTAFSPELSLRTFLDLYRLPGEYAADLVADHLSLAVVWANRQLEAWKAGGRGEAAQPLATCRCTASPGRRSSSISGPFLPGQGNAAGAVPHGRAPGRRPTTTPRKAADGGRLFRLAHDALADLLGAGRVDITLI